tara:strand:- start:906 stop:1016 length:111 start_codon:yes stop_codon:yes gene_type:complete
MLVAGGIGGFVIETMSGRGYEGFYWGSGILVAEGVL